MHVAAEGERHHTDAEGGRHHVAAEGERHQPPARSLPVSHSVIMHRLIEMG